MPGLDPGIHVLLRFVGWTWMAVTSTAMTINKCVSMTQILLSQRNLRSLAADYAGGARLLHDRIS